jgi:hypothetical protein
MRRNFIFAIRTPRVPSQPMLVITFSLWQARAEPRRLGTPPSSWWQHVKGRAPMQYRAATVELYEWKTGIASNPFQCRRFAVVVFGWPEMAASRRVSPPSQGEGCLLA